MRNWIKNGGRIALMAAGFAVVGAGVAQADTIGGDSHVVVAHHIRVPVSVGVVLSGNAGDQFGTNPVYYIDGDGVGVAASGGLSLAAHVSAHTLADPCGATALYWAETVPTCGNAVIVSNGLKAGLAASAALSARAGARAGASAAHSSLVP